MNKSEYKKLAQMAVRENAELACDIKALRRELALYEDAIYPTPPEPEPQTMTATDINLAIKLHRTKVDLAQQLRDSEDANKALRDELYKMTSHAVHADDIAESKKELQEYNRQLNAELREMTGRVVQANRRADERKAEVDALVSAIGVTDE